MEEKLIVVTGFGPFAGHELVNASWEAVRLLPNKLEFQDSTYTLEKKLVPVVYEEVDRIVDEIWKKNPELVIHVGVHGAANRIHLEKLAYNNKFCRPDYTGRKLPSSSVCLDKNGVCCERLHTKLDVDQISKTINVLVAVDNACACSIDVGDYLCGYIYLKSLDRNCERCLFIHVPPVDKPFSSQQTSEVIFETIKQCLLQLTEKKNTDIVEN